MSVPTPPQVGALLAAADERFATFIAICVFGGLRLGEAAALQVGDVDFLRRRVVVSRQVRRGPHGTAELRPPEHGSERTVVVPDRLLTLIAGHIERHLAAGGRITDSSPPDRHATVSAGVGAMLVDLDSPAVVVDLRSACSPVPGVYPIRVVFPRLQVEVSRQRPEDLVDFTVPRISGHGSTDGPDPMPVVRHRHLVRR